MKPTHAAPRIRVCIVEDDASIREALADSFTDEGYTVAAFADGGAALDAFDAGLRPDAIILDLSMPTLDGFSFRVELRKRRTVADVPIVIVTANASPAARAIDAFAYLAKPVSFAQIREQVLRAVEYSVARQATFFDREAERHRALSTLVSGLAFELEAPIAKIEHGLTGIEVALDARAEGSPARGDGLPARSALAESRAGVEQLRRTLEAVSRLSDDGGDWGPVDVAQVIESATAFAAGYFRGRALLTVSVSPLPLVLGSESRLGFALLSLLVNAAQASEATGDPDRVVELVARGESGRVVLEVKDRGVGISPANRTRVFEPYFTTRPRGEGAGLGLSIALQTVRSHDGELTFESTEGVGTTFRISLPSSDLASATRVRA